MQWLTLVATSAAISALVAGILAFMNSHFQRKADDRKRLSELAIKMAMAEWENHMKIATEEKNRRIPPPEIYLYRYSKIIPLIEKRKFSLDEIKKVDNEVSAYIATRKDLAAKKNRERI